MLFCFSKKKEQSVPTSSVLIRSVKPNMPGTAPIQSTEYEERFFAAFEQAAIAAGLQLNLFSLTRMGNRTIRVYYSGIQIGGIRYRKNFGCVQILLNDCDVKQMNEAPIEAAIAVIPYLIKYAIAAVNERDQALKI